ncbi:hypothetical protein KZJ38_18645 [Paraburkholderia edwinii]|jgi:hypothetical protein|uniref:Enamine deaminase RidA (YjgF/YER057c/UK114 family) n=1 Tax=Paraburkholderia edwinii TaxID=2861782 RepID=A0ABX8UIS9_9BURK|nr:Rid family hydrolase [Paraburkholderia edwinii]QYD68257.1 hypothetical protein KZJ38_18645 [Paraburkholderia edwinii]
MRTVSLSRPDSVLAESAAWSNIAARVPHGYLKSIVTDRPIEDIRSDATDGRFRDAAGCTFEDVVEMTTYHVQMSVHMSVFREVKNRVFPRGKCAWTAIGVSELAHPGLLAEIKCVAIQRSAAKL